MQTAGGWWSVVCVLVIGLTTAHAACPPLHNTNTIFKAEISWTYNSWSGTCTARHVGSHVVTEIPWGQTTSVAGLGNDCLQFTCGTTQQGGQQLFLNSLLSSCALDTGCSSFPREWEVSAGCSIEYKCVFAVYNTSLDSPYYFSLTHSGHISVFSGYTCGATGSGPCSSDKCYNPYASANSGKQCLSRGQTYKSVESNSLTCKELPSCHPAVTYLDLRHDVITLVQPVYVPVIVPASSATGSDTSASDTTAPGKSAPVTSAPVTSTLSPYKCPFDDTDTQAKAAYKGCYMDGKCYNEGDTIPSQINCLTFECIVDARTKVLHPQPKYSDKEDCQPSTEGCPNTQGCWHEGTCHPVNHVIEWDDCTQFVCNDQNKWVPRPTGCYGPKGCMAFGMKFIDKATNHSYKCRYTMQVTKNNPYKYAKFYASCPMPNKQRIVPGESILSDDDIWYACKWDGELRTVRRSDVPSENSTKCNGKNPDTGDPLYTGMTYHLKIGQCWIRPDCSPKCTYYFYPCLNPDESEPKRWLSLGEKAMLGESECVCTQYKKSGNVKRTDFPGSTGEVQYKFKAYLCGQKGVKGAACKDQNDFTPKQWGELWKHSGNPTQICTCDPETRDAFCSSNLDDVLDIKIGPK